MKTMLPSGVTHPKRFVPGSLYENATYMSLLVAIVDAVSARVDKRRGRVVGNTADGAELYFEPVPNQDPRIGASRTSASMTLFAEAIGLATHEVDPYEKLSQADLAAIDALLSEEALFNGIVLAMSQYLTTVIPAANRGPRSILPNRKVMAAYLSDRAYAQMGMWRQYQLAEKTDMVALPRSPIADTQFQLDKETGIPVFAVGPLKPGRVVPNWGVVPLPSSPNVSLNLRLTQSPDVKSPTEMTNYAFSAVDLVRQAFVPDQAARDTTVADYIAALRAFPTNKQVSEADSVAAQLNAWWISRANNPADSSRVGGVGAAAALLALRGSTMGALFDTWVSKSPEFAWPFSASLLVPLSQNLESVWLAFSRFTFAIYEAALSEITNTDFAKQRGFKVVGDLSCVNQGVFELVDVVPTSSAVAGEVISEAGLRAEQVPATNYAPLARFSGAVGAYIFKGDLTGDEVLADSLNNPGAVVPAHKLWRDAPLHALPSVIRGADGAQTLGMSRGRETLAMQLMHKPTIGTLGLLTEFFKGI